MTMSQMDPAIYRLSEPVSRNTARGGAWARRCSRSAGAASPTAVASPVPTWLLTASPRWRNGRLIDQCADQLQQLLLFRAFALTEEHSDLDVGYVTSRWEIGLMFDEHLAGVRIAGEIPSIAVRAVIELFGTKGHLCCSCTPR